MAQSSEWTALRLKIYFKENCFHSLISWEIKSCQEGTAFHGGGGVQPLDGKGSPHIRQPRLLCPTSPTQILLENIFLLVY